MCTLKKYILLFPQVFPNELESQPEFEGFAEWLQTFQLYRGKKSDDDLEDENRIVGKFKVRNCGVVSGTGGGR